MLNGLCSTTLSGFGVFAGIFRFFRAADRSSLPLFPDFHPRAPVMPSPTYSHLADLVGIVPPTQANIARGLATAPPRLGVISRQ
jgi:hypothetical protein